MTAEKVEIEINLDTNRVLHVSDLLRTEDFSNSDGSGEHYEMEEDSDSCVENAENEVIEYDNFECLSYLKTLNVKKSKSSKNFFNTNNKSKLKLFEDEFNNVQVPYPYQLHQPHRQSNQKNYIQTHQKSNEKFNNNSNNDDVIDKIILNDTYEDHIVHTTVTQNTQNFTNHNFKDLNKYKSKFE